MVKEAPGSTDMANGNDCVKVSTMPGLLFSSYTSHKSHPSQTASPQGTDGTLIAKGKKVPISIPISMCCHEYFIYFFLFYSVRVLITFKRSGSSMLRSHKVTPSRLQ